MNFSTKAVTDIANILATEANQAIEKGEIKNITEMETWIREVTKMVGQQAFQQTLEQEDQKLGSSVECECGGLAKRISTRPAKIVSVFGVVEYCRSYYGCQHCGKKKHEVDKQLGIQPGEVSPALSKLLTIAGVETAFEKGVMLLKEFLLIDISDNTIRKYTQLAGEKQAQLEARWIAESHEEAWLQARERSVVEPPERLYGSIDGAHVPIGDEWRELKTLGWYRVDKVYGQKQPKAQDITYHTDIKPAQQFGSLLWATGVRRMADKARELIFVCDGAAWIWKLVSHYFPQAVQIVDWYHACEYLAPIAEAAFQTEKQRQTWIQQVQDWLWEGKTQKVIRACQKFVHCSSAAEAAHRAVTYYTNNQHRMDYPTYRKKGYWIGSGTIESACKQIASARLKIAGARWTLPGAITTAKARAAWLSDDDSFSALTSLPLAV